MLTAKERLNNLKNLGKDWNKIKNNPYAHQKFIFNVYKWIIILVGVMILYTIGKMIFATPSSGNNSMVVLTRAFMVLVGLMMIFKLYGQINTMKTTLTQYEANPNTNDNYLNDNNIDTGKEIDDILTRYDTQSKGGQT